MQTVGDNRQTRRLQLVGGSTYVISLPKRWVDDLQVKTGSYVSLSKNPNRSITLFKEEQDKSTHAITTVSKSDSIESLRRKIIAMYLSGYNVIEIRAKGTEISGSHRGAIRDLVRGTMMGTEIIDANSERMVLQVLTHLSQLSFKVALKRMYTTATNMHRDAINALGKLDTNYGEEVAKMDDEVDRFGLYIMRNLNLALENTQFLLDSGLRRSSECLEYRTIVRCVERVADHAALIAKKIKYIKRPADRGVLARIEKVSGEALGVFEDSVEAFLQRDYSKAERVASDASGVIEKEKKLMNSLRQNGNTAILKLVLEDVRRTAEYSSDIAEVVIDSTVHTMVTEK